MYCSHCGTELAEAFRFCPQCGVATAGDAFRTTAGGTPRPLRRSRTGHRLAGVCAGLASYLGVDVTLVRIATVILALWPPGLGVLFYLICWVLMPEEPLLLPAATRSETVTAA